MADNTWSPLTTGYNLVNLAGKSAQDNASESRDVGLSYLNRFGSTLAPAKSFFSTVLSGSPGAATPLIAPDANRMREQEQQQRNMLSAIGPRGGGRSQALFDLPLRTEAGTTALYNQLRPQAAEGLLKTAGMEGSAGEQQTGLSAGLLGTAATAGTNLTNTALKQQEMDLKKQQMLGQFIGSMLGMFLGPTKGIGDLFGLFGGGKGGNG